MKYPCRIRSGHSFRHCAFLRPMAQRSMSQKSKQATMDNNYMIAVLRAFCQAQLRCSYPRRKMLATNKEKWHKIEKTHPQRPRRWQQKQRKSSFIGKPINFPD